MKPQLHYAVTALVAFFATLIDAFTLKSVNLITTGFIADCDLLVADDDTIFATWIPFSSPKLGLFTMIRQSPKRFQYTTQCSSPVQPYIFTNSFRPGLIYTYTCLGVQWVASLDPSGQMYRNATIPVYEIVPNHEVQLVGRDASNTLYRFDDQGQVLWRTTSMLVNSLALVSATRSLDGQTLYVFTQNQAYWAVFNYSTGALLSSNLAFSCSSSNIFFTADSLITICPKYTTNSIQKIQSRTVVASISIPHLIKGVAFGTEFMAVFTQAPMSSYWLSIINYNMELLANVEFPVGLSIMSLDVTATRLYALTINPSAINWNFTIASGLNLLTFEVLPPEKPVSLTVLPPSSVESPTATPRAPVNLDANETHVAVILSSAIAGVVVIGATAGLFIWARKRKSDREHNGPATITTALTGSTAASYQTNMVTLFNTQIPLAIPGYLEIRPSDFRFVNLLAAGGSGSIYVIELLHEKLRASSKDDAQYVAKVPLGNLFFCIK